MQERLKKPAAPGKAKAQTTATQPQVMTSPARTPAWTSGHQVMRAPAISDEIAGNPHPPTIVRADYVFIMGKDPKGTKNPFYTVAERYFRTEVPSAKIITSIRSLDELLDYINTNITSPIGDLYVVSHGNEDGTLSFALDSSDLPQKGKKAQQGHGDGKLAPQELRNALNPENGTQGIQSLNGQIDEQTTIRIRGCNIGQNEEMVNMIDQAFGGRGTVIAPTHEQGYYSKTTKQGKKRTTKYYGALSGPILQRPGTAKFTRDEINEHVGLHYNHLPQGRQLQLAKDLFRRQAVQSPIPFTFKTDKAPSNTAEARTQFKQDMKDQGFTPDRKKEAKITTEQQEGTLKLTYELEGTTQAGKTKEKSSVVFNLTFSDIPNDSDAIDTAKKDFPNPEDYQWRVDRKISQGRLTIRVIAERVFVRLEHQSLDAKEPFNPEESDDFFYTTSDAPAQLP